MTRLKGISVIERRNKNSSKRFVPWRHFLFEKKIEKTVTRHFHFPLSLSDHRRYALSMGKKGKKRKKMGTAIDDDRDRSGIIFDPDRRHWIEDR